MFPKSFRVSLLALSAILPLASGCKKSAPAQQAPAPSAATNQTALQTQELTFVQSFYDWYQKNQSYENLVKNRPELLDVPLLAAFRNDINIQAKSTDGIDGLDYDPFGYGQDSSNISGFKTTGVVGDRVSVIAMDIKNQPMPDDTLSLQVHCTSAGCVIVNIFFPDSGKPGEQNYVPAYDMLGQLKLLHPSKK